jgi:hypothetical protein
VGTREYLGKLNLDQLRYARDTAVEMIAELEKEQKLVVWCLEDRDTIIHTFSEANYVKAAEKLLEVARDNAASPQGMKARDKELHLVALFVPASEYAEWEDVPPNARAAK